MPPGAQSPNQIGHSTRRHGMGGITIGYCFYNNAEPTLPPPLYYDYSVSQIYLPNLCRVQRSQCSLLKRRWEKVFAEEQFCTVSNVIM